MPRTKEFEIGDALDAAMELFWCRGYTATSVRDLLDVMGLGHGSFYNTFGDKHTLFLASLDRFRELRTSWIDEALKDSGLSGIEEVFQRTTDNLVGFEPRRGCLLANTAVELAPHDSQVAEKVSHYIRHTEEVFEQSLIRAYEAGEIPATRDPRAAARSLVNTLHGLRVLARAGASRAVLEDAVRVALDGLIQPTPLR